MKLRTVYGGYDFKRPNEITFYDEDREWSYEEWCKKEGFTPLKPSTACHDALVSFLERHPDFDLNDGIDENPDSWQIQEALQNVKYWYAADDYETLKKISNQLAQKGVKFDQDYTVDTWPNYSEEEFLSDLAVLESFLDDENRQ